jgi:hypothetical protein
MAPRHGPGRAAAAAALVGAAAAAATAATAATGCGEVIGLGPEATLAQEQPDEPPPVDTTSCGLEPHPKATCTACAEANCCAESQACAAQAQCPERAACAVECTYDTRCIGACAATYKASAYEALQRCQLANCLLICLPPDACQPLVACCQRVPAGPLREACTGPVNLGNEQGCRDAIAAGLFAPYCPDLAPAR